LEAPEDAAVPVGVPVGVVACQVRSVPPKLSFCPSPLTCPALWSNENVYSGRPSKETCLDDGRAASIVQRQSSSQENPGSSLPVAHGLAGPEGVKPADLGGAES